MKTRVEPNQVTSSTPGGWTPQADARWGWSGWTL